MKPATIIALILVFVSPARLMAVSVKNTDSKAQTIFVTDSDGRRDIALKTDQQVSVCIKGCFITFPNGDKFAFEGDESVEITNSRANFR